MDNIDEDLLDTATRFDVNYNLLKLIEDSTSIKTVDETAYRVNQLVKANDGNELLAFLEATTSDKTVLQDARDGNWGNLPEDIHNTISKNIAALETVSRNSFDASTGITPNSKPLTTSFNISNSGEERKEIEPNGLNLGDDQSFGGNKIEHDYSVEEDGSSFLKAADGQLQNSYLGMAIRINNIGGEPVYQHKFSEEELLAVRNSGLPASYLEPIFNSPTSNITGMIELMKKNYENDQELGKLSFVPQLGASLFGALGDPTSYVPLFSQAKYGKYLAKILNRGAEGAAWNVVSEGIRTSVSGGDADYASALVTGFAFTGGMTFLSDTIGRSKGTISGNLDAGTEIRMEARLDAMESGIDKSLRPWDNTNDVKSAYVESEYTIKDSWVKMQDGVLIPADDIKYKVEDGGVRLEDGSFIDTANPVNPLSAEIHADVMDIPKANRAISLGGLGEIGQAILRSDWDSVRTLGYDLVRPVALMPDGSNGKFAPTASDVYDMLKGKNNSSYTSVDKLMKQAIKSPEYRTLGYWSDEAKVDMLSRKVATAIEDTDGKLFNTLTPEEKQLAKMLTDHFNYKEDLLRNPASLGNPDAKPLLGESRLSGHYYPVVYDPVVKADMILTMGSREALQKAIADSRMVSFKTRQAVRERLRDYFTELEGRELTDVELEALARKKAMDEAYGISHTDQFDRASAIDDNISGDGGLVGIENNQFLDMRSLFDNDLEIKLDNGMSFSVNDLRDFSIDRLLPAYDRRIDGDLAIMGGTGKTTLEVKNQIAAMKVAAGTDGAKLKDVKALQDLMKTITGRSRRNPETVFEHLLRGMQNYSFFAKNAYMWAQNFTEIGGAIAKGNTRCMLHNIPFLKEYGLKTSGIDAKELDVMHNIIFGRDLGDAMTRGRRSDWIERIRTNTGASQFTANAVGSFRWASGELAARSPFTKWGLVGTQNMLVDGSRKHLLVDMVEEAFQGKKSKLITDGILNGASVTRTQYEDGIKFIMDSMVKDSSGKYRLKDPVSFRSDPRVAAIWRLGDKLAHETMMRPHVLSSQYLGNYGAGMQMLLQFKNFTLRTLNGRVVKAFYESKQNGRVIDQALSSLISIGLSGAYYVAQAHVKASALPDKQREKYLQTALSYEMIGYSSIMRSSTIGAPLSIGNMGLALLGYDFANIPRSTILPRAYEREQGAIRGGGLRSRQIGDFTTRFLEQVPAAGVATSLVSSIYNAAGLISSNNRSEEFDYRSGMMEALQQLVPNDPLTQRLILSIYEEQGIYYK